MSLTQQIQDALTAAGLSMSDFTLSSPDEVGGITVTSMTNDYDQVVSAENALEEKLSPAEYILAFARSMTNPALYVRTRPAGF